ncbi:MAG: HD domain-containing phosphohydrolase, partial [Candidatus Anammoxibacter sp.]
KRSNVSAYTAMEGQTVNIPDVYESDLFDFTGPKDFDASTGYRSKSMLTVPMKDHEGEVVGVFQLLNSTDMLTGEIIPFSENHVKYAEAVASQAAVAINNVTLLDNMQTLFESFVEVMATAIDEKSPVTGGHVSRMGSLTLTMGRVINDQKDGKYKDVFFNEEQLNELRIAALLHDIGKVVTPAHVMEKGKKLETIFDRVYYIDTRFKYLMEKCRTRGLQSRIDLMEQSAAAEDLKTVEEDTSRKIAALAEMRDFITKCNDPKEFMEDDKIERLKTISKLTYKDNDGQEHNYLNDDELLNLTIRKGSITEDERKIMQRHATVTLKMLEKIPFTRKLRNIPNFAGVHHERPNGKGYPLGIKGEEIPFEGLIMAVTDIAEALTASDRPYKKAMPLEVVYKILREMGKNNELDADLVELFISKNIYGLYKEKENENTCSG